MGDNSIKESKSGRFKRIAAKRTQGVLDALRKLGNCSNKGTYHYSGEEVTKIFVAIDHELRRVKMLFTDKVKSNTFTL